MFCIGKYLVACHPNSDTAKNWASKTQVSNFFEKMPHKVACISFLVVTATCHHIYLTFPTHKLSFYTKFNQQMIKLSEHPGLKCEILNLQKCHCNGLFFHQNNPYHAKKSYCHKNLAIFLQITS